MPSASMGARAAADTGHRAPTIVAFIVVLALALPGFSGAQAVDETGTSRSAAPAAQATPDAEAPPCAGDPAPDAEPVLVTFGTNEGTFRAVFEGPRDIAVAYVSLTTGCQAGIPIGDLRPGDGGFNAPHAWHQVGTSFVDFTVELCDATAEEVDRNLDYWLDTVGYYCPWQADVLDVQPASAASPGTPVASPEAAVAAPNRS